MYKLGQSPNNSKRGSRQASKPASKQASNHTLEQVVENYKGEENNFRNRKRNTVIASQFMLHEQRKNTYRDNQKS